MIARLARLVGRLRDEGRPVRFVVSRVLLRTRISEILDIRIPFAAGVVRFQRSTMAANLWVDPEAYERDGTLAAIRAVARPGDVVVDVGAHIGLHTLTASRCVGPRGRVVSLEPHPVTFRQLRANLEINDIQNVDARQLAAARAPGRQAFSDQRLEDRNHLDPTGPLNVSVDTLDAVLADVEAIRLLKIDVEGSEVDVLAGAADTLLRTDFVLVEAWDVDAATAHLARFTVTPLSTGPGYVNLLANARGDCE